MLRGFDVSHHQGSVDWSNLKKLYGLSWGAAKATEGRTFKDDQFGANWRKMKAAGLVRMAYHFAHPGGDPRDSALPFLSYIEANGGIEASDIMVMDMEANQLKLPGLEVRDWLAGWADIIARETGRKPFLYAGSGFITNNTTKDLKPHYAAWWFPRYPSAYNGRTVWPSSISGYPSPNNWGGVPDIWQFSESFAGGNLDANIANMTLVDLKTRGLVDKPRTDTPTAPQEEDDMSYSEAQMEQFAGIGVHGQKLGRSDVTIGQAIDVTYKATRSLPVQIATLTTQVAGLTAALKALAEAHEGVDADQIIAVVKEAMNDVKITLEVQDDVPEPTV